MTRRPKKETEEERKEKATLAFICLYRAATGESPDGLYAKKRKKKRPRD